MNIRSTKQFVEEHDVVVLRADKGEIPDVVETELAALGNPSAAIPFYAIYGPGGEQPITFSGPITGGTITGAIKKLLP